MGTPEFAVPILDVINKRHQITLVISQSDQYDRRKKVLLSPPVIRYAKEQGLNYLQPEKIKDITEDIRTYPADLIVTAAYGQFIPPKIIDYPRHKAINVHGSLLPKYRGGAPIQRALLNDEKETGISVIYMTAKMDAGDILMQKKITITDGDNQDTIFRRLSLLGRDMILSVIADIEQGNIKPQKQNPAAVTFANNLTKADELIDFKIPARAVFNKIRALNPNPGAYFVFAGMNIKVYAGTVASYQKPSSPGVIVKVGKDYFDISCGNNTVISITEIQLPGKKRMAVRDFLNGKGRDLIKVKKEIK